MKIKLIGHGCPEDKLPARAHANDVGADVYALRDTIIEIGCSKEIPLGFGLDLPAGFGAFIFPRSSQSKRGVDCKLAPLDPGYTGEMHALIHNSGHDAYHIYEGDRIGQLVVLPVALPDFVTDLGEARGAGAFGSRVYGQVVLAVNQEDRQNKPPGAPYRVQGLGSINARAPGQKRDTGDRGAPGIAFTPPSQTVRTL